MEIHVVRGVLSVLVRMSVHVCAYVCIGSVYMYLPTPPHRPDKDKGIRAFPNGIILELSTITRREFELAFYNLAVQLVYHNYTTEKSLKLFSCFKLWN